MRLAVVGPDAPATAAAGPRVRALADGLVAAARARGHEPSAPEHARLVVNLTSAASPEAHWRRDGLGQFGVSVLALDALDGETFPASRDVLAGAYPALLRTLSNAVVAVGSRACALVTPELGVRALPADADAVLDALLPLAGATFAIENDVRDDLEGAILESPAIAQAREGGRRLAALGLLPSPVPMQDVLTPQDLKLLRAVYGLQQISYGNVSVREPTGGFWMTGRGVDKARIEGPGRDLLLVVGHAAERGRLTCRVPRGCGEARVSVDALEHALLYAAFPSVGAIVHAHAWIDGVACTRQNWPCGTRELALDVLELVRAQPDPGRADVGLRNHGLTLTGPDVASIFARAEGRLRREVPAA